MPEPKPDIEIATDERAFFAGRTDSGKTFLARHLLRDVDRLVVFDPKGNLGPWRLAPWDRESQRLLKNGDSLRARVHQEPTADPDDFWSGALFDCWNAGNVLVYVDEVYLLKPESGSYPSYLSLLYTTGRERGVGAWAAAQRPAWIPIAIMSESEHVFCFRLQREDDRIALAKNTHEALAEEIPAGYPHGFRYWNIHEDTPLFVPEYSTEHGEGWGDPENAFLPLEELPDAR